MPIYEYLCEQCGETLETLQRFADPPPPECPKCGGSLRKKVSAPAFQFKGSGWYVTDYARKGEKGGEKGGDTAEKSSGSSESSSGGGGDESSAGPVKKAEPKSESKPESSSESSSKSKSDSKSESRAEPSRSTKD